MNSALSVMRHPLTRHLVSAQHVCKYACSEEVPEPVDLEGDGFSVAFDPLDGSSIVDTNFTVRIPFHATSASICTLHVLILNVRPPIPALWTVAAHVDGTAAFVVVQQHSEFSAMLV